MTTLKEKRFVIFDAAQIDVDSIVSLAYQSKEVKGLDADGKPTVSYVQVAVVMLDTGSSVTLGGSSLEKLELWWKKNVPAEKIELPATVPDPIATAAKSLEATGPHPASAPADPATPPAPPPLPVVTPPTPTPPTPQAPVDPPAPGG